MKQEKIVLHNTPDFYLAYCRNWLAKQKKDGKGAAEVAVVEDIAKLVEIAVGVLEPVPTESEKS